jgi:Cu/Ag efflux protein CusF
MFRTFITASLAALLAIGAWAQTPTSEGEVRKVDKRAGKVTLQHGEIKNLDMPPMTMVFTAREPALLDKLKPGDKVRFQAEKDGGTYVVTAIERH